MSEQANYHLAQLNIARGLGTMEDPIMADFVAQLDGMNALAEASPGFVWRLKDESGNATDMQLFTDPLLIVNMSVWEDVESLHAYTYRSAHAGVFKRKKDWFAPLGQPHMVLWWVPAGHEPTTAEAKERLAHLQTHGPTPHAFTFVKRFTAAGERL